MRRRFRSRWTPWTTKRSPGPAPKRSAGRCWRRYNQKEQIMPSGFSNQAKIMRGAFVEFGVSQPPLIVAFQFNPLTITRTRTARVNHPETPGKNRASNEDFIKRVSADKLFKDLRNGQNIIVAPQTLGFDIRLDATDKLN